MISAYFPTSGQLVSGGIEVFGAPEAQGGPVWVDLLSPSREEEEAVETLLGIDVPTREEMREIEASSRLSRDGDVLTMTTAVVANSTGLEPVNTDLTFILTKERLVTVRYDTPQAVANFLGRCERTHPPLTSGGTVLLALAEAIVDRLADVLERVGAELDSVSRHIFHQPNTENTRRRRSGTRELEAVMRTIGRNGDLASKARYSILGLRRMAAFLPASDDALGVSGAQERIRILTGDLQSLSEFCDFLNNKTEFLLDATLGAINIQQNHIIKLFSVVAVLFLPPTLVASIYGMNFHIIPELDWVWGYPYALVLMVAAAVLPYWIFKRKGWL